MTNDNKQPDVFERALFHLKCYRTEIALDKNRPNDLRETDEAIAGLEAALQSPSVANADCHSIPDAELPGMWDRADFEGGRDEVRGPDWTPPQQQEQRCPYCDNSGDVHRADGEWLGECTHCKQQEQSVEAVAEIIECPVMGQQTVREIDGKWKFLKVGDKLYTAPSPESQAAPQPLHEGESLHDDLARIKLLIDYGKKRATPEGWRDAIEDIRSADYTFGENCKEAVRIVLDSVEERLDELDSTTHQPVAQDESEAQPVAEVVDNKPYWIKEAMPVFLPNGTKLYPAPPSALAIETAAIMRAAEVFMEEAAKQQKEFDDYVAGGGKGPATCFANFYVGAANRLLALTPANAEAELEALMMKAVDYAFDAARKPGRHWEQRPAIVRRVLDEKGE